MKDWRIVSLNDLGEVNRGKSRHRPRNDPSLYGGPYPFIQTGDVKASQGLVKSYSQTYSEKGLAQSRLWPKGTMAITIAANIAETAILDFPACFPDSVVGFIPDERRANVRFVEYLFRHLRRQIQSENVGTGSVQDNINLQTIGALDLLVPPKKEQDRIAATLGALDDKIELNRRMSATLEEMARALYRSWFVDFDPVHARALGQSPAHMDPTTAALFPDSFGPDGLPRGWEREPLADHVRATRGLSYKGKHLCGSGDGVPLHNLNSIFEGGGYKDEGAKYYDGDFKPRHEIRPGDLIVANTEQSFGLELIGHAALVPFCFGPSGIFSQHLYKIEIRPGSPLSREWVYLALSIAPLGVEIRGFSNGTTVNMLPADAFEIPEAAIPPAAVVEKMNEIVRPAFAQQERLREESRTLADLRDALLPRLMSGELRIREAEKEIEELV
mgnify:CR=1 FL=1